MTAIPLGRADFRRRVARTAPVLLRNRFFEENPVLTKDQVALIARPGMRYAATVGEGPIRHLYNSPGAFDNDLFVVSGLDLYRVDSQTLVPSLVGTISTVDTGSVSMAASGNIGDTPGHLFIADGGILWCYTEDGYAQGTLSAAANAANGDTVTIDTTVYQFTNASVDAGAPAGTALNPWLVALGLSAAASLDNLFHAINDTGTPGTDYSTALTAHTTVAAFSATAVAVSVRATVSGIFGNAIVTTETGANLSWGGATLADGGNPSLLQVPTPDDVGVVGVGHINSFTIIIPAQGEGINGRFYWIEPGEIIIDPLNFATAERATDAVLQVIVFGDQFWLMGQTTVEPWYMTGDPDAPVLRVQGVVFDGGTWEGTAIQVRNSLIVVDPDGGVHQITGGTKRISTPDIEERIREAIQYQASRIF